MFFDDSTTGGYGLGTADGNPGGTAYQYFSPNQRQYVRFSPTGATFVVAERASLDGAEIPLFWSFAKPFRDGTTWSNIGFEAIDPRGALGGARMPAAAGTAQHFSMKMHLISSHLISHPHGRGRRLGPTCGPTCACFPDHGRAIAERHAQGTDGGDPRQPVPAVGLDHGEQLTL